MLIVTPSSVRFDWAQVGISTAEIIFMFESVYIYRVGRDIFISIDWFFKNTFRYPQQTVELEESYHSDPGKLHHQKTGTR